LPFFRRSAHKDFGVRLLAAALLETVNKIAAASSRTPKRRI
jgi:hypothetical protein